MFRKDNVCEQQDRLALPIRKLRICNVIMPVMRPRNQAINKQPRRIAEITQLIKNYVQPFSFIISDDWDATKNGDWDRFGIRYEFCMHFRKLNRATISKFRNRLRVKTRAVFIQIMPNRCSAS